MYKDAPDGTFRLLSGAEVELVVSIVKACADDRKKLCPGLKSGKVVRECMKSHMGDLGNVCKTALAKAETGNK